MRAQKIGTNFKFRSIERQKARQKTEMSPVGRLAARSGPISIQGGQPFGSLPLPTLADSVRLLLFVSFSLFG
jgi:hypothetical protein